MYERFTDAAREVMSLATQEAARLNHPYIGTEHVLIALTQSDEHPGGSILRRFEVDVRDVRRAVSEIGPPEPEPPVGGGWTKLSAWFGMGDRAPMTSSIKHVIERAMEAARADESRTIGTHHLLHGICGDDETVAYQALLNCGVEMAGLQAAVDEARQRAE